MELVISDKARSDLLRIYRYLEERSPNAAYAFGRRIDATFANVVRFLLSAARDRGSHRESGVW